MRTHTASSNPPTRLTIKGSFGSSTSCVGTAFPSRAGAAAGLGLLAAAKAAALAALPVRAAAVCKGAEGVNGAE